MENDQIEQSGHSEKSLAPQNSAKKVVDHKFEFEKYKHKVELIKWIIGSVVLVIITTIIDWGFRDRAAGLQEIQQYDKYVTDLIVLNKEVGPRRLLAQYFSTVTASDKLRKRWEEYYAQVDNEYKQFLIEDSIMTQELLVLRSKSPEELSPEEQVEMVELEQKKEVIQQEINSDPVLPGGEVSSEWVVILTGSPTYRGALESYDVAMSENLMASVYKKRNQYHVVIGPFGKKWDAKRSLSTVKRGLDKSAFVEELNVWCKNSKVVGEYVECDN